MRLGLLLVVFLAVDAVFAPLDSLAAHGATGGVVVGFGTGALALFAYAKLVGWLEQRDVPEVSPRTLWPQLPLGFLLGVTLFAATILLIFVAGGYHVAGRGSVTAMIATFGLMAGTAVFEELLFRGVLFRIVEERAGTILALVVSGLLFGGLHLLNRPTDGVAVVIALAQTLPLAFRRLRPAAVLLVVLAGFVVQDLRGYQTFAGVGLVVALYSAAATRSGSGAGRPPHSRPGSSLWPSPNTLPDRPTYRRISSPFMRCWQSSGWSAARYGLSGSVTRSDTRWPQQRCVRPSAPASPTSCTMS